MRYLDFLTPPKGFGNVPFYWWNGERLDLKRIEWQLEKLAENGVSGIQINFMCHCPDQLETVSRWNVRRPLKFSDAVNNAKR